MATTTGALLNVTEVLQNLSGSDVITETLDQLNARYAHALLPFAVLIGVFCLVGILGNTLVIVIFSVSQEYRNTNFRVFVISLGIIDLLSCVSLIPVEIVKTRQYFYFQDALQCKTKCFFNVFAMNAAAFVLFVICIDRFRKVCQPLKKQIWPQLALKISVAAICLSIVLSVPAGIMCGIQKEKMTNIDGHSIDVQVCSADERFQDNIFRLIYKFGLTILLVIVSGAFIVMYIMIVRVIINHRRSRSPGESLRFDSSNPRRESGDGLSEQSCVQLIVTQNACHNNNQPQKVPVIENYKFKFVASEFKAKRAESSTSLSSTSSQSRYMIGQQQPSGSANATGSDITCKCRSSLRSPTAARKFPYKTLIWLTLTLIFLLTYILNAGLSFLTLKEHLFSPTKLFLFQMFFRLYFVNNIINPVVYALLDKRFKASCRRHFVKLKKKIFRCCCCVEY